MFNPIQQIPPLHDNHFTRTDGERISETEALKQNAYYEFTPNVIWYIRPKKRGTGQAKIIAFADKKNNRYYKK